MENKPHIGVALTKCFFCLKDGNILLNTRLTEGAAARVESMHGKVVDLAPCNECLEWMKKGIILLVFDPAKSDPDWNKGGRLPNPYRTGHFIVAKEEAVKRIFNGEPLAFALKERWCFIEIEAARKVGMVDTVQKKNGKA